MPAIAPLPSTQFWKGGVQALVAAPDEEAAHFSKAAKTALAIAIEQFGRARMFSRRTRVSGNDCAESWNWLGGRRTPSSLISAYILGRTSARCSLFCSVQWHKQCGERCEITFACRPKPLEAFAKPISQSHRTGLPATRAHYGPERPGAASIGLANDRGEGF